MIFVWTIGLLLIFSVLNYYFFIDSLVEEVYTIPNIPALRSRSEIRQTASRDVAKQFRRQRWWYTFVYTATVFFSLTLKFENLKFSRRGRAVYFLAIYLIGLVCIAYMANFVLQK